MSNNESIYPSHANTFTDTKEGVTYRASNVNKCKSCQSHLMKRQLTWPPKQWQCDKCGQIQTDEHPLSPVVP